MSTFASFTRKYQIRLKILARTNNLVEHQDQAWQDCNFTLSALFNLMEWQGLYYCPVQVLFSYIYGENG